MAERRELIELVGAQLSALIEGVELTDGFGLFIVAARTWMAAAVARVLLHDRLPQAVHADLDVDTAARELTQLLAPGVPRTTIVHCGGIRGTSGDAWRPLFRRLNENRNAIGREHDGALVVIVSEAQIEALAGEAPDLWSIAIVRVVGWLSMLELHRAMARDYAVLESLMVAEPHALTDAVRRLGYPALLDDLNVDDRKQAARELYELRCGQWTAARCIKQPLWHRSRHPCIEEVVFDFDSEVALLVRLDGWPGGTVHWRMSPDLSGWWSNDMDDSPLDNVALALGHNVALALVPDEDELTALRRLLDVRLTLSDIDIRICIAVPRMLDGAIGEFLRRWFDVVLTAVSDAPAWHVLAGTAELAPVVSCPPNVGVQFGGPTAHFHLIRAPVELGGPTQLWLPRLHPDSLGAAQLYAVDRHRR